MKSGVYKIENKINQKKYVGSSKDIDNRWKQHIRDLNKSNHHSIKLQRAWDKYGESNFEFSILEECEEDRRLYTEQYYIDTFDSFYNGYNCSNDTLCFNKEIYIENIEEKNNLWNGLNIMIDKKIIIMANDIHKYLYNKQVDIGELYSYIKTVKFLFSIFADLEITEGKYTFNNSIINNNLKDGILNFEIFLSQHNYVIIFNYNIKDKSLMYVRGKEYNDIGHYLDYNYDGKIVFKDIMDDFMFVKFTIGEDIMCREFTDEDIKYLLSYFMYMFDGFGLVELHYKNTIVYDKILDYYKRNKISTKYGKRQYFDKTVLLDYDYLKCFYDKSYEKYKSDKNE